MKQDDVVNEKKRVDVGDLFFISDSYLRRKIVDSIDTISGLYLVEKDSNYSHNLTKEIRRTIILYSASIIEALLLHLYNKTKKDQLFKTDYFDVHELPKPYQSNSYFKLVIAKQRKIPKESHELMLDVLLKHFSGNETISKDLERKIKRTKDIRNTFHLSKSRTGLKLDTSTINICTEALYETIVAVKNSIDGG